MQNKIEMLTKNPFLIPFFNIASFMDTNPRKEHAEKSKNVT